MFKGFEAVKIRNIEAMTRVNSWGQITWISNGFRILLALLAISFVCVYIFIALRRISYPFELEWMEGGAVEHVRRILLGYKLYVKPSLEFTPFIYNPLYFYVAAALSELTGIGFFPLRLVSFVSSIGCFILIYLIVKTETENRYCAIVSGCLFAATYKVSGIWFDIARVDSLFLLLFLSGVLLIRRWKTDLGIVMGAAAFSLSYFCKQPALLMIIPVVLYFWIVSWRYGLVFSSAVLGFILVPTLLINWLHEGWYWYYIFYLPRNFPITEPHDLIRFWTNDLALPLSIGSAVALFYFFFRLPKETNRDVLFFLLTSIGMVGASWLGRIKVGGHSNVLFPAYAIISILFGIGLHKALQFIGKLKGAMEEPFRRFIFVCCLIQFVALAYNPLILTPTQRDLEAGQKLIRTLREIPGDVFIPSNPHMAVLAGKPPHAMAICMRDIGRGDPGGAPTRNLAREIDEAFANHKFGAVITVQPERPHGFPLEDYYVRDRSAFDDENVFWTVTGFKSRLSAIWVPRGQDPGEVIQNRRP